MRRDSAEGLSKCARCKNRFAFAKGTARGLAAEGKTRQRTMVTYAGALESIYRELRQCTQRASRARNPSLLEVHRLNRHRLNRQLLAVKHIQTRVALILH